MSDLEALLERMIPGSGRRGTADADTPDFPSALGLEPLGILGRGGSGVVFRARDPLLQREVAVKVGLVDEGNRDLLLEEARRTARLAHPAVLPVHRVVVIGGRACIEFRLAPATTLATLLTDWRGAPETAWPAHRRLGLMVGVASALGRAHALDVVHGDLHPANIALGDDGDPYVLDWTGRPSQSGFSGTPGYAATEQLRGAPADARADVYALGALLWELAALRAMRPWRHEEPLGSYLARWSKTDPVRIGDITDVEAPLAELITSMLAPEPEHRPTAAFVRDALSLMVGGGAEVARRAAEGARLLDEARGALIRYHEGRRNLTDEQRVAFVLRAKIPGHAPVSDKRPFWDAERRVAIAHAEQAETWIQATEAAMAATVADPDLTDAHAVLAELWWERMRIAESRRDPAEEAVAERRVRIHDRGRFVPALDAPAHVSLDTDAPGATVEIARFDGYPLAVSTIVDTRKMPVVRAPMPPGSYLLTVRAPGYADAVVPVHLGRLDHHRGSLRMYTRAQIGDDYCFVPAGSFRMGGDPRARNPVDPCTPWIGDRFVSTTCVRCDAYLAFLNAIPAEAAERHAPGEVGVFGGHHGFWHKKRNRWALPEGWDPAWPVMGVSLADAEAYATWRSKVEGRTIRPLTEEEWEKASRGVDGRQFPWGDGFDPTFCHMRESQAGAPRPSPVGRYPIDRSVYGVLDTAGGMREWTSSTYSAGQMVIRGGTWGDDGDDCRCAGRSGLQPPFRFSFVSFRVVSEAPRPV